MPNPNEMLVRLPDLVAGMLTDLNIAFRRVNAGTLEGLSFSEGPVFRMGDSQIQMRGRMAKAEGQKILFFPAEQSERGAEFAISLPVRVEHPPEDTPWQLAMGLMVFSDEVRRKVYRAAIRALTFLSMDQIGAAPVWRLGPGEYFVQVPGERPRGALVSIEGNRAVAEPLEGADALWGVQSRLNGLLAGKYEAVVGKITE